MQGNWELVRLEKEFGKQMTLMPKEIHFAEKYLRIPWSQGAASMDLDLLCRQAKEEPLANKL